MTADRPDSALRPYVTDDQRRAADPATSVWVAASAGAGKTKALADRVLRLLLDGAAPERLLCLTFTRAAAAEMAIRINGELGKWTMLADDALHVRLEALAGAPPDADLRARARRQFATVLDAPGGLKIMTIHAFCQSLLGRFPLEAGVAPHAEVLDDRSAAELLVAAQAAVLERARSGAEPALAEAVDTISVHAGEETFVDLMARLRGVRARLRRLIRRHETLGGLVAATGRLLGVAPGETVETVIAEACAEGAFNRDALAAACRALESGSEKDRERARRIAGWIGASPSERGERFNDYSSVFLTADDTPRAVSGLMTKPVRDGDRDAFEALSTEQEGVARAVERRKAVTVARATAALLRLGGAMLDEYDRAKAARARLDYDDLIRGARDLLRAPGVAAWVLYKLDGGIDHILVDEAQDTSPEQWEVIAALAEEFFAGEGARETRRTVFIVGDEKQSIFSFQGADPRALEAMRAHFRDRVESAAGKWREVGLGLSFRSTEAVLEAVDAVFASPAARDGVAFADHVIAHASHRKGHAGTVELWPLVT
ncbi:MAG: UvrD-helicase domain-containing protein, partial [Proteobacteria bacterium]|nr:UvrD-helicase domain-containing protein [Pseudomonadota bacterium]